MVPSAGEGVEMGTVVEAAPRVVHQSDLQAYNYCPKRAWFERQPGAPRRQLSATAYGTVVHSSLQVFELAKAERSTSDEAERRAQATFEHYWHPMNIGALTDPVPTDGWIRNDSYGSLLRSGRSAISTYRQLRDGDRHETLALEYEFQVPMRDEHGEPTGIWLAGTIDKLAVRWHRASAYLSIEDFKAGKPKWGLRHNVQGTVYAYATLQPEFWYGGNVLLTRLGSSEPTLYEARGYGAQAAAMQARFEGLERGFRWISLYDGGAKGMDGGFRGPTDFARMREAVEALVAMDEAGIHPLRIDGETCEFCPFRGVCGTKAA